MIRLFEKDESRGLLTAQPLGILSDALSCIVTEERNGAFELEMTYPINGAHAAEITPDRILFTKARPSDEIGNPFRIYAVKSVIKGLLTISAQHLFYDLNAGVMLETSRTGIRGAVTGINNDRIGADQIRVWFNGIPEDSTTPFVIDAPRSLAQAVAGATGSLLDVFGGELGYTYEQARKIVIVTLYAQRGTLLPYTIRYGVNMTEFEQVFDVSNCYTAVYPVYKSGGTIVKLSAPVLTGGEYTHTKILYADLTGEFETTPTQQQLWDKCIEWIIKNKIGVPDVSINVGFVGTERNAYGLSDTALNLCDEIHVSFPGINVETTAKVVKAVYNVLTDRYDGLTIGTIQHNVADTIAALERAAGM